MKIVEIAYNRWKIYDTDCTLQQIAITDYRNMSNNVLYWRVSVTSFNGKYISIKDFLDEESARKFVISFLQLLQN